MMPMAPFGRMRAHIDHAAGEALVAHRRHRDQHLAVEIAALGTFAAATSTRPTRPAPAPRRRRIAPTGACSSCMPVLRPNFMSKCYLIGRRLQTTAARRKSMHAFVRQCTIVAIDASRYCVIFMYLATSRPVDHASAHDEFNGARKVSPIDRPIMITGLDRLRRTVALGAIGICASAWLPQATPRPRTPRAGTAMRAAPCV